MSAEIIDGKAVAAKVREEVRREVEGLDRRPGLATILVGDDPASAVYVRMKREDSAEVGIESFHHEPGGDVGPDELAELITGLNADDHVDGILLQLPLPDHLDQDRFVGLIDPAKDVDGLTTANAGLLMHSREEAIVPCTPAGVMRLLEEAGVELSGRAGGRARPVDPRRQADGPAAARGERDRDPLSLPHARPRRGVPAGRCPGGGRRVARAS